MKEYWFVSYCQRDTKKNVNSFYTTVIECHPSKFISFMNLESYRCNKDERYSLVEYNTISEEDFNLF